MTGLPRGWIIAEIATLVEPQANGKPFQQGWSPQCESRPADEGEWGVVKTTAIQHGEFRPHENKALPDKLDPRPSIEIQPGDVLLTCAGPRSRCGVACLVEHTRRRLMMSGKMYRFRPHPKILLARFLTHFIRLRTTQLRIDEMKTGISDSGLNLTHSRFGELPVVVPPLNEQRRIVERIEVLFEEIDRGVESLRAAKKLIVLYRQSLLKSAFEGRLTAEWRAQNPDKLESPKALIARIRKEREARYQSALRDWECAVAEWGKGGEKGRKPPKPKALKIHSLDRCGLQPALPELPYGWMWSHLGQCSTGPEYGTTAKSSSQGNVPVVRMGNIQDGRIEWRDLAYSCDEDEIGRYSLQLGDVLFNRTNSPELVGKAALYRGERPALFAGYLVRVNQIDQIASGSYVAYFLNSPRARAHGKSVKTDGVNQSNINGTKLQEYPFPICSPDEQAEVVRILDTHLEVADVLEAEIDANLSRADALRESILKQAFAGELVPQDPNDEPAVALLAKIQAERAKAPATKGRKQSRTREKRSKK